KEAESCPDEISSRRQIRTIERIAHFEPQRVARAQAARFDSKRFAFFERRTPKLYCIHRAKENFDAVFASVAGARDGNSRPIEWKIGNRISRWKIGINAKQSMK